MRMRNAKAETCRCDPIAPAVSRATTVTARAKPAEGAVRRHVPDQGAIVNKVLPHSWSKR